LSVFSAPAEEDVEEELEGRAKEDEAAGAGVTAALDSADEDEIWVERVVEEGLAALDVSALDVDSASLLLLLSSFLVLLGVAFAWLVLLLLSTVVTTVLLHRLGIKPPNSATPIMLVSATSASAHAATTAFETATRLEMQEVEQVVWKSLEEQPMIGEE
jgi:hypothetical protein